MQNHVSPELRRNTEEKMIFGVAAGLSDYFGIDVAITRVIFVVTAIMSLGLALLVYFLLAIFVPEQPEASSDELAEHDSCSAHRFRTSSDNALIERRRTLAGWVVAGLGIVLLATNLGLFTWLSFGRLWPILLIALGIAIIAGVFRGQQSND